MIRRTAGFSAMVVMTSFATAGNAGTAAVTPSLAACSKALVETLAKAEPLPAWTLGMSWRTFSHCGQVCRSAARKRGDVLDGAGAPHRRLTCDSPR